MNRIDRGQGVALSCSQQRVWFLEQLEPGSGVYTLPLALLVSGTLDSERLQQAIEFVIARHDILRTRFAEGDSGPLQFVCPEVDFKVHHVELGHVDATPLQLQDWLDESIREPFDFAVAPMFRADLVRLADEQHCLLFNFHQIVCDEASAELFLHEMLTAYTHGVAAGETLPELTWQYADYAQWQQKNLQHPDLLQQSDFWMNTLRDLPASLEIPADRQRPGIQQFQGAEETVLLDAETAAALDELAEQTGASLFALLLAALTVLLHKYSGQQDICLGSPVPHRNQSGTENLIGCFSNMLVLRNRIDPHDTLGNFLQQVEQVRQSAAANQDLPFEKLLEDINPARDTGRTPVFQAVFTLREESRQEVSAENLRFKIQPGVDSRIQTDLCFDLVRCAQGLRVTFRYATAVLEADIVRQMLRHLTYFLRGMTDSLDTNLSVIKIMPDSECQELQYSATGKSDLQERLLLPLKVAAVSDIYPESEAVVAAERSLSFSQLNQRVLDLALYLQDLGVAPGSLVGVSLDRTEKLLISVLAIMRAGCAYVPLDPAFPTERLQYMLDDAAVQCLITQESYAMRFQGISLVVNLDTEVIPDREAADSVNLPQASPDDLAYVIYTSGSTGQPKGVMVPHSAVANFLYAMAEKPGFDCQDRLLAITTLSFDISVLELFLPLITGGTVVIADSESARDGERLLQLMRKQRINCLQATPSTWRMLLASGWNDDLPVKALCGGESLPADLAKQIAAICGGVWNMYGPTETTVWSACAFIDAESDAIGLGEAVANTQIYLLDEHLQLVPRGVAGELCIGGFGVTRGYIKRDQLTAERFVPNHLTGQGRLYRTGDKARFRSDGQIEYLGRTDDQVKVRGYRIELGDIETAIRRHPAVTDCAVVVRQQTQGDTRLSAFVVWNEGEAVTLTEMRKFLQHIIPAYMIPQHLASIDALPRTLNGKLNRNALPAIYTAARATAEFRAPQTADQKWLAEIWSGLLRIERVSLYDNFYDLGGHSLLSMQVIAKAREVYAVKLNPRHLLLETLEQVACRLDTSAGAESRATYSHAAEVQKTSLLARIFKRQKSVRE